MKGEIKEKVRPVTNNSDSEAGSTAERRAGKVEKKVGQIKEVLEK